MNIYENSKLYSILKLFTLINLNLHLFQLIRKKNLFVFDVVNAVRKEIQFTSKYIKENS